MSININSESWCRKAYLDYHCYGNTMNLTAEEMGKITGAWSHRLSSWQATVASDETEYDFDDSDYSKYKEEGRKAAASKAGDPGSNAGNYADSIGTALFAGAGAVGAIATTTTGFGSGIVQTCLGKFGDKVVNKATEKATKKAIEKGANAATKEVAKEGAKDLSAIGTAIMTSIVAAAYWVRKPNKDGKEACDALQQEMAGAQSELTTQQSLMEDYSASIQELSDENTAAFEESNEEVGEKKADYDENLATITALKEKVASGQPLTESEQALYDEVAAELEAIGVSITDLITSTEEIRTDIFDEIEGYQDGYDETAESMGQIEGLADFAASFDEDTRTMCTVEAISQGLNSASAARAAVRLFAGPWWRYAFGVMASLAAASSLHAANEQREWIGEVGNEIDAREATQALNSETMSVYEEEIDAFDGYLQGVNDIEHEIPEDFVDEEGNVKPPEVDLSLPNSDGTTSDTDEKDKPKLKPEEDEK